jgi:hypothetical protein
MCPLCLSASLGAPSFILDGNGAGRAWVGPKPPGESARTASDQSSRCQTQQARGGTLCVPRLPRSASSMPAAFSSTSQREKRLCTAFGCSCLGATVVWCILCVRASPYSRYSPRSVCFQWMALSGWLCLSAPLFACSSVQLAAGLRPHRLVQGPAQKHKDLRSRLARCQAPEVSVEGTHGPHSLPRS